MAVFKEIGTYQVQYASNKFAPRIWLRDKQNQTIGQLVFRRDGQLLPNDSATSLYFHLSNFAHLMDLLRNEKPLYYHFVGSGSGNENAIRTSSEPQGEGEAA